MRTRHAAIVAALALPLLLAGCNGNAADQELASAGEDGTVEIDVSMIDIDFQPDSVSVPSGATLVVNLTNEGSLEHDFQLEDGSGSGVLQAGESDTVEVGPFTESTVAYCTVPGHREAGMEFEISVD